MSTQNRICLCSIQFSYILHSLAPFCFLSSHLQSSVKAEDIQPLSLVRYKRRNNRIMCLGAYWNFLPQICGPHQAQKGWFLLLFIFSSCFQFRKKETERERRWLLLTPSCQVETELLSILGLWVCDSCELPSVGVVISLKDSWSCDKIYLRILREC